MEKGPDFFVEVAKRMPNTEFVMIGPSVTEDKLSITINQPVPPNVKCLGRLLRLDLIDCFSAAGILLNHAKSKFGGNVILEAMASKTISIVAVEGSNEGLWFEPFSEGLTYEHNNIGDCLEKINYAQENPNISLHALRRVLSEYDWEIVIKKYDELYDSIV